MKANRRIRDLSRRPKKFRLAYREGGVVRFTTNFPLSRNPESGALTQDPRILVARLDGKDDGRGAIQVAVGGRSGKSKSTATGVARRGGGRGR